jgi:2,4-dienoyl-CoA reductase-like NADH-dependent reductase (Old Yellow Enzyme family)
MSLFTPISIRSVTVRNRLIVSPMCMYSSVDGFANDWHLVHLGQFATGGAGMVLTEANSVSPEGRISPQDLGIWKDEHVEMLARISKFVREHGAVFGSQLAHAGRKASTARPWEGGGPLDSQHDGWSPIHAPSALAFDDGWQIPVALDDAEIERVIRDFKSAAERALAAEMQIIEVHGAHGYLLHEFLSPIANRRTDRYGGSFENRIRLLRDVIAAIRTVWPERLPLAVRISATDWRDDGWTADESIELAKVLGGDGVDLIDCSTGGIAPRVKIPVGPGYQVQFAERVKTEAGVLSAAVGLITGASQADTIVRSGQADFVVMAREMLRDPHFALRAAKELNADVEWPKQYLRAKR